MDMIERKREIVRLLADCDLKLPPGVIYDNLEPDYTRRSLDNYLADLETDGLIEHTGTPDGYRRITEKGRQYLDDE